MTFSSKAHETPSDETPLADDLLKGVVGIASFIGETPRRTHYLLEKGDLPGFKMRGRWRSRKSSIRRHFEELEAEARK